MRHQGLWSTFQFDAAKKATPNNAKSGLFEIEDFSFDIEQTLNIGSQSTGAGAGKVTFNPFSITRKIDRASPTLFEQPAPARRTSKWRSGCARARAASRRPGLLRVPVQARRRQDHQLGL